MSKSTRLILAAAVLLLVFFSAPFWLPSAMAAFAGEVQPESSEGFSFAASPIFLIDSGHMTGYSTMQVHAVPQILAWSPSQAEPMWAVETGFAYGGFYDANGRVFIVEQRSAGGESLLGMNIGEGTLYRPNDAWPLFLTVIDAESGELLSREELESKHIYSYNNGIGHPVAINGDTLYFMTYSSLANLVVYDLASAEFTGQTWDLCAANYPMQVAFVSELNGIAALCMDYSSGMQSSLSFTDLADGEQTIIEIPVLGEEEYMTGNGLVLGVNNNAYVMDTDAQTIVEVDLTTMEITRTVNYAEALQANITPGERVVAWLLEKSAGTAYAKRWMSISAISADGRWLAVDAGIGLSSGNSRSIFVIDLETLQAAQEFELPASPTALAFGEGNLLFAFLDKSNFNKDTRVIAIDLARGTQSEFAVPMASPAWNVFKP